MIAWLGTGLLGANFVKALRKRGEDVRVWNRTAAKAKPLADVGAVVCDTPAEAARGAARVHVVLSADAAVDEVLEQASAGFAPGVSIVDHTTTSPDGAAARAKRWAERGFAYVHAPVFMGPINALEGTGAIMVSGDKARFEALEPVLKPMTGNVVYLGPDPAQAARFKLMGNLMILAVGAGMADMLSFAKAQGIPAAEAATLIEWFNPAGLIPTRLKRIIARDFANPSWELEMARKDARLMIEGAGDGLITIPSVAAEMDRLIAAGHAKEDWLVIAEKAL